MGVREGEVAGGYRSGCRCMRAAGDACAYKIGSVVVRGLVSGASWVVGFVPKDCRDAWLVGTSAVCTADGGIEAL